MTPILYLGNKNYSSWSLRPWLVLKWAGITFEEKVIPLGGEGYGSYKIAEVVAVSPSGRVPALKVDDITIWDSLAIAEWAIEKAPTSGLLPADASARAICRSLTCEMHSSFAAIRRDLSMNIRRRTTPRAWPQDTLDDITRVQHLWTTTRKQYGASGPFLFGKRTLADAFFAPVVTRFRSYGVSLDETSAAYSTAVLEDSAFKEWEAAGIAEPWTIGQTDSL